MILKAVSTTVCLNMRLFCCEWLRGHRHRKEADDLDLDWSAGHLSVFLLWKSAKLHTYDLCAFPFLHVFFFFFLLQHKDCLKNNKPHPISAALDRNSACHSDSPEDDNSSPWWASWQSLILLGSSLEDFWVFPWENSRLPQSALAALVCTATLSSLGSGLAVFHGLSQAATTLPLTLPPVTAEPSGTGEQGGCRIGCSQNRHTPFAAYLVSSLMTLLSFHHVFTNHPWVTKIVSDLKILPGSAYLGNLPKSVLPALYPTRSLPWNSEVQRS